MRVRRGESGQYSENKKKIVDEISEFHLPNFFYRAVVVLLSFNLFFHWLPENSSHR
ncbi:hypothetical protein DSUL_60110 [Desulfovibrionales bacterium]